MSNFQIPNELIFIWIGKTFPWPCKLAMLSAAKCNRPEKIWLIQKGLNSDILDDLHKSLAPFPLSVLHLDKEIIENLPLSKNIVGELNDSLTSPASIANLVRLAFLWKNGGVYLDGDTISIGDLGPLRRFKGFCGLEPLALPSDLFQSKNPFRWAMAGIKLGAREVCARVPKGHQAFRWIEPFYNMCVNNAVLGSIPGNPIIKKACEWIEQMPPDERLKRFRLGTHLLQKITLNISSENMEVLPSEYFYPLGPEVSAHWFKPSGEDWDKKMLGPNSKVVHWYHSVEKRFLKGELDENFVRENPSAPFSKMAAPYLG